MPVQSVAYYSLPSRQGPQQHPLSDNSLKGYSGGTLQPGSVLTVWMSRRSLTYTPGVSKPAVLNYTWLTRKMVMVLALTTVKETT